MADRIGYSQYNTEDLAKRIRSVAYRMMDIEHDLSRVDITPIAGGEVEVHVHASLSGTASAYRVSGNTVAGAVRSSRMALDGSGDYLYSLARAVSRVSVAFQDTETALRNGQSNALNWQSWGWPSVLPGVRPVRPSWTPLRIAQWMQKALEDFRREREEALRKINQMKVFDENYTGDTYGGRQHGPLLDLNDQRGDPDYYYEQYRQIVKKNLDKNMSLAELRVLVQRLNSEGCGYAAAVNLIMRMYEGRAADFERDFGFPMYDEHSGRLNYNMLLLDLYTSTDNHYKNIFGHDAVDNHEDAKGLNKLNPFYDHDSDTDGYGLTNESIEYRTELYLQQHNVDADLVVYGSQEITVDNVMEKSKDGDITIFVGHPFYMYRASEDGTVEPYTNGNPTPAIDAGHFMTITGVETVTVNGEERTMYVVSSWGDRYYVDPSDPHGHMSYQQLRQ